MTTKQVTLFNVIESLDALRYRLKNDQVTTDHAAGEIAIITFGLARLVGRSDLDLYEHLAHIAREVTE